MWSRSIMYMYDTAKWKHSLYRCTLIKYNQGSGLTPKMLINLIKCQMSLTIYFSMEMCIVTWIRHRTWIWYGIKPSKSIALCSLPNCIWAILWLNTRILRSFMNILRRRYLICIAGTMLLCKAKSQYLLMTSTQIILPFGFAEQHSTLSIVLSSFDRVLSKLFFPHFSFPWSKSYFRHGNCSQN